GEVVIHPTVEISADGLQSAADLGVRRVSRIAQVPGGPGAEDAVELVTVEAITAAKVVAPEGLAIGDNTAEVGEEQVSGRATINRQEGVDSGITVGIAEAGASVVAGAETGADYGPGAAACGRALGVKRGDRCGEL